MGGFTALSFAENEAPYLEVSVGEDTIGVTQFPKFRGGLDGLMKHISDNSFYPYHLQADSVQGKVIVSFTVNLKGKVKDVVVIDSDDSRLNVLAFSIVESLPVFEPGYRFGKKALFSYTLPLNFVLTEEDIANAKSYLDATESYRIEEARKAKTTKIFLGITIILIVGVGVFFRIGMNS